jgi:hypothetical protein
MMIATELAFASPKKEYSPGNEAFRPPLSSRNSKLKCQLPLWTPLEAD